MVVLRRTQSQLQRPSQWFLAASARCNDVPGRCLLPLRVADNHSSFDPHPSIFSSTPVEVLDGVDEGPLLLFVTFHCLPIFFSLERRMVKFDKSWPRRQFSFDLLLCRLPAS